MECLLEALNGKPRVCAMEDSNSDFQEETAGKAE